MYPCDSRWYLVRTKPGKERSVAAKLTPILSEVFLPMLRARTPRWGRVTWSVAPLFPCYLFVRFSLQDHYFDVRYMSGVRGLVSAGRDPLAVPEAIVEGIKARGINGLVELDEKPFGTGQRVRVVGGPFRGFEAVFDRYLSGDERVAILLSAIEATGLRVVLSASAVSKCD